MIKFPKELIIQTTSGRFDWDVLMKMVIFLLANMFIIFYSSLYGFILNKVIPLEAIIITIIFITPIKNYGNAITLLISSIQYIFKLKMNYNYLIPKKIIQKGNNIIPKQLELHDSERLLLWKQKCNIIDIITDDKSNYITYENGTVSTILKFEILELPLFIKNDKLDGTFDSFHNILKGYKHIRLFTRNKKVTFNDYHIAIDKLRTNNSLYEKYYELKKWQVRNAEQFMSIQYYIEIEAENLDNLHNEIDKLVYNSDFKITILSDLEFNEIIYERIDNNLNKKYFEEYILDESTGIFETYLKLDKLEQVQNYFCLMKVCDTNYDVVLDYKVITNPTNLLDKARKKIGLKLYETRNNSNNSNTDNSVEAMQLIIALNNEISNGIQTLLDFEMLIKVTAHSEKQLQIDIKNLKEYLSDICTFTQNYFRQEIYHYNFNSYKAEHLEVYPVPSLSMAKTYPFNYMSYMQDNGILKNSTKQSVLFLDPLKIDDSTGQTSYDKLVFANKGAGKSVEIKNDALETLSILGGSVIMIDFDGETRKLVNGFNGDYVQMGDTKINPLYITPNPIDKNQIEGHIEDVVSFLEMFYGVITGEKLLNLKTALRTTYEKSGINEFSVNYPDTINYPSFNDVKETLMEMEQDEGIKKLYLSSLIGDMINSYPSFSVEGNFSLEFTNRFTSLGFSSIKDKEKTLNALLFWSIKSINHKMRFNKMDTESFKGDICLNIQYLKLQCVSNFIKNDKIDSLFKKIEIIDDHNKAKVILELESEIKESIRFLRILIDESHRITEIPKSLRFALKMCKESRKYYTGITLVDHSPLAFVDGSNHELNEIWGLAPYKLFMNMGKTFVDELILRGILTESQSLRLKNPLKGQGILLINDRVLDYYSQIDSEFIEIFDGGK